MRKPSEKQTDHWTHVPCQSSPCSHLLIHTQEQIQIVPIPPRVTWISVIRSARSCSQTLMHADISVYTQEQEVVN